MVDLVSISIQQYNQLRCGLWVQERPPVRSWPTWSRSGLARHRIRNWRPFTAGGRSLGPSAPRWPDRALPDMPRAAPGTSSATSAAPGTTPSTWTMNGQLIALHSCLYSFNSCRYNVVGSVVLFIWPNSLMECVSTFVNLDHIHFLNCMITGWAYIIQ